MRSGSGTRECILHVWQGHVTVYLTGSRTRSHEKELIDKNINGRTDKSKLGVVWLWRLPCLSLFRLLRDDLRHSFMHRRHTCISVTLYIVGNAEDDHTVTANVSTGARTEKTERKLSELQEVSFHQNKVQCTGATVLQYTCTCHVVDVYYIVQTRQSCTKYKFFVALSRDLAGCQGDLLIRNCVRLLSTIECGRES